MRIENLNLAVCLKNKISERSAGIDTDTAGDRGRWQGNARRLSNGIDHFLGGRSRRQTAGKNSSLRWIFFAFPAPAVCLLPTVLASNSRFHSKREPRRAQVARGNHLQRWPRRQRSCDPP